MVGQEITPENVNSLSRFQQNTILIEYRAWDETDEDLSEQPLKVGILHPAVWLDVRNLRRDYFLMFVNLNGKNRLLPYPI